MEPKLDLQVTTVYRVKVLWLSVVADSGVIAGARFLKLLGLAPEALEDETAPLPASIWHEALQRFAESRGLASLKGSNAPRHPTCLAAWARVLRGAQSPAQAFAQLGDHGGDVPTDGWMTERLAPSQWEGSVALRHEEAAIGELCSAAREAELASLPELFGLPRGRVRIESSEARQHFVVTWSAPVLLPGAIVGTAAAASILAVQGAIAGTQGTLSAGLSALGAGVAASTLYGIAAQRRRSWRGQTMRLAALERAAKLGDRARRLTASLQTGRVLAGQYRLGRRLGVGASSAIWNATRVSDGAAVAVKLLKTSARHDSQADGRLRREAWALTRIAHPNVVKLLNTGELSDGSFYLVLERLQGETLLALIERAGPLRGDALWSIALGLCEAVEAVHSAGIIHRDLKPANVNVSWNAVGAPHVTLFDFGVAKIAWDDAELTEPGIALGTPGYMAPEQRAAAPADARSDVFALGSLLFECATGEPFWPVSAPGESEHGATFVTDRLRAASLSAPWQPVLERALAVDTDQRFQSASQLREALLSIPNA